MIFSVGMYVLWAVCVAACLLCAAYFAWQARSFYVAPGVENVFWAAVHLALAVAFVGGALVILGWPIEASKVVVP